MFAADLIVGQSIGLVLAIPSFLLYSLQCAIVIGNRKNNHFNTSFYKFFLLSAFNNLFLNFLCSSMFGMRLTWIPAFVNFFLSFPPWLSGAVFAINYYNLHAENLLTIFMLFQRLTAILRPFDFEKIWHFLLPISAFLCFSLPLLPIWHLFGLQVRYYQIGASVYLSYDHSLNVTSTMPSNSQILFISSAISLLLYCILNAVIFAAFKASQGHHQNSNSANNGGGRSRIEFRLLIYSIAIFFAQSLVCIYWIWMYIFTNNYNLLAPLFNQYIWLNDLRTVVLPSWFLLWASGEMRKNVKEIVFKFGLCLRPKTTSNSLAQSNVAENENGGQRLFTRTTPRNP